MEHENDKIIADNLKLVRSYIFLKREVILLRTEREDRERKISSLEAQMYYITDQFSELKSSFYNIKEMQNYTSSENAVLKSKIHKLESLIYELIDDKYKEKEENKSKIIYEETNRTN